MVDTVVVVVVADVVVALVVVTIVDAVVVVAFVVVVVVFSVVVGAITSVVLEVAFGVLVAVDAVLVVVVEILVVVVDIDAEVEVTVAGCASSGIFNLKSFLPGHFSRLMIKFLMVPSARETCATSSHSGFNASSMCFSMASARFRTILMTGSKSEMAWALDAMRSEA